MELTEIFHIAKPVIGMLHLPPLPGSPQNTLGFSAIVDWVVRDAEALTRGGVDALMIHQPPDPFCSPRVVVDYIKQIAESTDLPIIAYARSPGLLPLRVSLPRDRMPTLRARRPLQVTSAG